MGKERDSGRESRSDIICLEGNGYRPSHKGDGWIEGGAMYTLNGTEVHAVCYAIDQQGGKGGANYLKDICPTILSDSHGTPHAVCYGISPYASNSMKSSNPHSGIYVAETARTLDFNGGNPACNQGGVLVLEKVQGVDLYNQCTTGGVSKTLNNRATDSDHIPCVLVYESHGQDCRYKPLGDVCSTVSQKYGTGGATRR